MLSLVQNRHVQHRCPTNCFTITPDGVVQEGIALSLHSFVKAEKKHSPQALFLTALATQQNGGLSFVLTSPENRTVAIPYFLVEVSTELTTKRARQFKRGDPTRRVTSGVIGTADTLIMHESKALVRMYDNQMFTLLRPDGSVLQFERRGTIIAERVLSPRDMINIRLDHAATLLSSTEEVSKRGNLYTGLIKLLRLQTNPELAELVLDFIKRQNVGTKVEAKIKAVMPNVSRAADLDPEVIPKLRIVKKERGNPKQYHKKKVAVYDVHRQTFAVHRSSLRA